MFHLKRCVKLRSIWNWNQSCKIISASQFHKLHMKELCSKKNSSIQFIQSIEKSRKFYENNDKFCPNTKLLSLAALSFGIAYCQSLISNKQAEKRFFRAVQYGVEHEVKR